MPATKLNETTELAIPLKNLIGLVAFTAISVWGYTSITERITFLEHDLDLIKEDVKENEEWIDNFTPPPEVQNTVERVRELELQIKELEVKQLQREY